ncbi:MAG: FAD-dependent oxidoreductase [Aurantimonas endophytica]|uniref:Glycine oxidase n=1 Tax=Aurantimonas endophytica TaxID=1522175 RepID=A0A7W6HHL5_9HYPH|nr:FAD-dependent oxidoreductase [Aurantimonas endophytica]MBB4005347.1 glycine oxidase [Aurantimonas endophytica]MCO6405992.1 FAD-dependent oxidoreductase [Aurantimonas endophytica]
MRIAIIGAGAAGLVTAARLAERGLTAEIFEASDRLGAGAASWLAGGMLAPYCEAEDAGPGIIAPGLAGIDWWSTNVPRVERGGTLVVAPWRDRSDLARFARRTRGHERIGSDRIAMLEPDLAGRFSEALFFPEEAHLDPRLALESLAARVSRSGGPVRFGASVDAATLDHDFVVDCRGFAAAEETPALRPVRGEMLILKSDDLSLSRPVRLLHPRWPVYVVPRGDGLFMVGATVVESDDRRGVTARGMVDLLNAAYALHPAFAEAEIVETGSGLRPAFPDNLPRVSRHGRVVTVNGLYRHGFLLSPAVAEEAVTHILGEGLKAAS